MMWFVKLPVFFGQAQTQTQKHVMYCKQKSLHVLVHQCILDIHISTSMMQDVHFSIHILNGVIQWFKDPFFDKKLSTHQKPSSLRSNYGTGQHKLYDISYAVEMT